MLSRGSFDATVMCLPPTSLINCELSLHDMQRNSCKVQQRPEAKGSCNGDKRPDPLPGSPGRLEARRAAAAAASSGGNLVVPTEISFTPRRRPRLFPKTRSWPHGDWFEAMLGRVSSLRRKKLLCRGASLCD